MDAYLCLQEHIPFKFGHTVSSCRSYVLVYDLYDRLNVLKTYFEFTTNYIRLQWSDIFFWF